jgi:urease accessory protein
LLRGGDVLVAEDGSMVRVLAAPQAVLRISACPTHGSPFDLTRAAYHLGNRHVPIELKPDHLKIEPDHVLADLLRAMHLIVNTVEEAFEPEGGAYSAATHAGHHHGGHAHDEHHGHGDHDEHSGHDHAKASAAPHVHGPGCGHDHGHDHSHDHGHSHDDAAPASVPVSVPVQFHAQRPPKA